MKPTSSSVVEEKLKFFLKYIAKIVKVAKTFSILKWTKKIKQLKQNEEGEKSQDDLQHAIEQLQSTKTIHQLQLAKAIVYVKFPRLIKEQESSVNMDDPNIQHVMSSKHFQQGMAEIEIKWKQFEEKELANPRRMRKEKKALQEKPAKAAKLVGVGKKDKIPLKKAMFVDTLDSEEVVVAGAGDSRGGGDDEVRRLKSLRNQRNRILNKFQREARSKKDEEDMNKYLPVHLRNLPEPAPRNRKNNKKNRDPAPPADSTGDSAGNNQDNPHSDESRENDYKNNKREERGRDRREKERPTHNNSRDYKRDNKRDQLNTNNNSNNSKTYNSNPNDVPRIERREKRRREEEGPLADTKHMRQDHKETKAEQAAGPVDISLAVKGKDWQQTGIHPSWAARQLKQQQQLSIPPQGAVSQSKKILFSED